MCYTGKCPHENNMGDCTKAGCPCPPGFWGDEEAVEGEVEE